MRICFTSFRPFADGPVRQPFQESDPANIAYALEGDYYSFYTLRHAAPRQLRDRLRQYDLVIVALDVQAVGLVARIVEACEGRAATYSEGHISDYQRLSPSGQVAFLQVLRAAKINFLYWEKYVSFYESLTRSPVEYLPFPYLLDVAQSYQRPAPNRRRVIAVPSGLAGQTRNGLASLSVAQQLLQTNPVTELVGWLEGNLFDEDARAVAHFLCATPLQDHPHSRFNKLRSLLVASRVDYRPVLRWVSRLRKATAMVTDQSPAEFCRCTLYRRQSWTNYLSQLASARLMIDLNNRETVGRNAMDCAALGIVCVSTIRSDMQARLFPGTTLEDSWDIEGAAQISRQVLDDPQLFHQFTSYAQSAVKQFSLDHFRSRFSRIIAKHF